MCVPKVQTNLIIIVIISNIFTARVGTESPPANHIGCLYLVLALLYWWSWSCRALLRMPDVPGYRKYVSDLSNTVNNILLLSSLSGIFQRTFLPI